MKIFIFGQTGMLGRYVKTYFNSKGFEVVGISRSDTDIMDVNERSLRASLFHMGMVEGDVVINCAGVIKSRGDIDAMEFIKVNSLFPHILARVCELEQAHLIHVTTDCFLPNTKVLTTNGYRNIQDLTVGEYVYTHNGNIKMINDTMCNIKDEDIFNINTFGNDITKSTSNHPWYAIKRDTKELPNFNNLEWVLSKDLKKGDLISIPKLKLENQTIDNIDLLEYSTVNREIVDEYNLFLNEIKNKDFNVKKYCRDNDLNYRKIIKWRKNETIKPKILKYNQNLNLNEDISCFLGIFLAEGWIDDSIGRKVITLSFGNEPEIINKAFRIIHKCFGIIPSIKIHKKQQGCQLYFTNPLLVDMLSSEFYFDKEHFSHTKKVPNWVFKSGRTNIISFLKAYFDGDGCFYDDEKSSFITMSSTSEILIDDIKRLFMLLDILPNKTSQKLEGDGEICDRVVKIHDKYTLTIGGAQLMKVFDIFDIKSDFFENRRHYNKFFENDDYWFVPVTDIITEHYNGLVYNIEVDDDHSYLVNGGLSAHNCVFNGLDGKYDEVCLHNPEDIYGKTKSLGEPVNCSVIRTSIIGDEIGQSRSLIEWVKSNKDKTVNGYTNHSWNGVTCLEFAKVCEHVINNNLYWDDVRHLFSPTSVSKMELVQLISDVYGLNIMVMPYWTPNKCDRTLSSIYFHGWDVPELSIQIKEQKEFYNTLKNNK